MPLPMAFVICSNKMTSYIQSKCNIQLVGLVTSHTFTFSILLVYRGELIIAYLRQTRVCENTVELD